MMSLLRANYGAGFYRVGNGGGWRKFHKLPRKRRARITCLTGHMPWGLGAHLPGPHRVALLLRDPVARVASLYWFVRGFSKHRHHRRAQAMGLGPFVVSGAFSDLDNGMTRWLAGRRDVGSLPIQGPVTADDARHARAHLRRATVGFVEAFDESVETFAATFGWTETRYTIKRTGRYPPPSEQEQRAIRAANRYDVALYEWARAQ